MDPLRTRWNAWQAGCPSSNNWQPSSGETHMHQHLFRSSGHEVNHHVYHHHHYHRHHCNNCFSILTYSSTAGTSRCSDCGESRSAVASTGDEEDSVLVDGFVDHVAHSSAREKVLVRICCCKIVMLQWSVNRGLKTQLIGLVYKLLVKYLTNLMH